VANEEHLKILLEGIDSWNDWRDQNPGLVPDLSGIEIEGLQLQTGAFQNVLFANSKLTSVNFDRAFLGAAEFTGAMLVDVRMDGAQAESIVLNGATIDAGRYVNAVMAGAEMRDLVTNGQVRLDGIHLNGARAPRAKFARQTMPHANLSEATLIDTDLSGAVLKGCNLTGADLHNANLRRVTGLDCETLTSAKNWQTTLREDDLACGQAIPKKATPASSEKDQSIQAEGISLNVEIGKATVEVSQPRPFGFIIPGDDVPPYVVLKDQRQGHKDLTNEQLREQGEAINDVERKFERLIDMLKAPSETTPRVGHNRPPVDEDVVAQIEAEGQAAFIKIRAPVPDTGPMSNFLSVLKEFNKVLKNATATIVAGTAFAAVALSGLTDVIEAVTKLVGMF